MDLNILIKQYRKYFNTLVIDINHKVVRLVDIVELDDDIYWKVDDNGIIEYISILCDIIELKGHIPDMKYEQLIHIWNLNNIIKAI